MFNNNSNNNNSNSNNSNSSNNNNINNSNNNRTNNPSITFLLFTAKWCDACQLIEPFFVERGEIFGDVANFKTFDIDDDENDQIAIQYKITQIPTIIVINNGKIVNYINEQLWT